jgi:transcriptional regulator with XRE-family HTH domain
MSEKINKEILKRLKEARQKRGLRQIDMAEKLGISRPGYNRIEHGKVDIKTGNLAKIAGCLQISLDWLILGKDVDQTKQSPNFSDFGAYGEFMRTMLDELKEDEIMMNSILSFFFQMKGKGASIKEKKHISHHGR